MPEYHYARQGGDSDEFRLVANKDCNNTIYGFTSVSVPQVHL